VLEGYVAYFDEKFDRLMGDTGRPPLDRLRAYIAECRAGMARHQWRRGCLVGNLAQELGARNDDFRQRLEGVLLGWQVRVAALLREAVACGDLAAQVDADRLAQFFWIGWEGALMRAKLTRDASPLDCFVEKFFALLPVRRHPDLAVR
jgi:TetR/AcrR family transcriptional repressor of nem operon